MAQLPRWQGNSAELGAALKKEHLYVVRQAVSLVLGLVLLMMHLLQEDNNMNFTDFEELLVKTAGYAGDASFALTGTLQAGMHGMDLFGCMVVGFITALGGGTVRDIALDRLPLFWATTWDEALLCIGVSSATFFLWPRLSKKFRLSTDDEWVFWTDTFGLGAFAASGAHIAVQSNDQVHVMGCAVAGMFSATFGGLTRDILCQKPPRILYSTQDVYALPALAGGAACATVLKFGHPTYVTEAISLGFWVTIQLRVLAKNRGLRLPCFPKEQPCQDAVETEQPRAAAAPAATAAVFPREQLYQDPLEEITDPQPHALEQPGAAAAPAPTPAAEVAAAAAAAAEEP